MNELERANEVYQQKRRALTNARAGLISAQQRANQRDMNYYAEAVRQAQEAETLAYTDVKRLMTP